MLGGWTSWIKRLLFDPKEINDDGVVAVKTERANAVVSSLGHQRVQMQGVPPGRPPTEVFGFSRDNANNKFDQTKLDIMMEQGSYAEVWDRNDGVCGCRDPCCAHQPLEVEMMGRYVDIQLTKDEKDVWQNLKLAKIGRAHV